MIECPSCRQSLPEVSKFCSICGYSLSTVAVTDPPVTATRPSELSRRLTDALSGRYRIGKLLGQGGMGAVFLADDLELDRQVAIKVLPTASGGDANFVERFRREARTAARLDHPNIIPIYSVESVGDLHYFVMRYVPGRSLEDVLADQPKLEVDTVRRVLTQAAEALAHAHRNRIVHRDVKPANIMLEGDRVVLTDFGISKAFKSTTNLTSTGAIIGTPTYMAPEQARGLPVDGRTDQYALAVAGFEMLAGRPPFESGDVFALIVKHMNDQLPDLRALRADAPAELVAALGRALAKEPSERFATMHDFARALDPATSPDVATVLLAPRGRTAPRATPRASPGRRWWLTGAAALVLVGLGTWGVARNFSARSAALLPAPDGLVAAAPAAPWPAPVQPDTVAADSAVVPPAQPPERTTARNASRTTPRQDPPAREPAPVPPPASPRVERARLTVGVDGSYATVFIDNELIGETPIVRELTFGEHEVRIEREGFKTIRQRLLVNGPVTRRYTLEPVKQP